MALGDDKAARRRMKTHAAGVCWLSDFDKWVLVCCTFVTLVHGNQIDFNRSCTRGRSHSNPRSSSFSGESARIKPNQKYAFSSCKSTLIRVVFQFI